MSTGHNHSMTYTKVCCPQHIFEITSMLKQQNRISERGSIVKNYIENHTPPQIITSLKDSPESKHKFLKICNEEICNYLFSGMVSLSLGNYDICKLVLDKINPVYKSDFSISPEVKGAFFTNSSAFYERTENYAMASMMIDEAIRLDTESHDDIACAVDYNNKAVLLLNLKKSSEAYKCSKKALVLLEPLVYLIFELGL